MNQQAYQKVTTMLNSFQHLSADLRGLLLTFDQATTGVPDAAIIEAAQRYTNGLVEGHNTRFAPSVAEFCVEARRIAELLPYRGRQKLPAPPRERFREPLPHEKARMALKLKLLSAATGSVKRIEALAAAKDGGMAALIALAKEWGEPIPAELEAR